MNYIFSLFSFESMVGEKKTNVYLRKFYVTGTVGSALKMFHYMFPILRK